ncbi:MAG: type II secretion system F family protein [Candidatus Liptonbacteria bacterium]|nr:type II secretion system F family protein [Candidatus Liptonbacteria bacterium]
MKFRYRARTKEGELQVGFVEAGGRDAAVNILSTHNLYVLSLTEAERERWYTRLARYTSRVRLKDMVIFTRQLATLLESRFPLTEALRTIYEQSAHRALKEAAFQVAEDVDAGLSLSQALERQGQIFSGFFVSLVRAAETTGNLDEAAQFLADYYERELVLANQVRAALIYPSIVLVLFAVVAGILVSVVFPQIGPIFEQAGVALPFFARILLGTAGFLTTWWPVVLAALLILIAVVLNYFQTKEGRALLDDMKVRLPLMRRVYVPLSLARFANSASVLLTGGVPVSQAMEIVSHTVENVFYQDLIHEAAEAVRRGEPLSRALVGHEEYFPPLVSQMLVIGETTGQLGKVFERLGKFYGREAERVIANLVELIQPALMVGIGILVAFLFASILVPLYQLTATVR